MILTGLDYPRLMRTTWLSICKINLNKSNADWTLEKLRTSGQIRGGRNGKEKGHRAQGWVRSQAETGH